MRFFYLAMDDGMLGILVVPIRNMAGRRKEIKGKSLLTNLLTKLHMAAKLYLQ